MATTDGNDNATLSSTDSGFIQVPAIADSTVDDLLRRLYGMCIIRKQRLDSYDDKTYRITTVQNQALNEPATPRESNYTDYVFKITNAVDTQHPGLIEAQNLLFDHLRAAGFQCPVAVRNVLGKSWSVEFITYDGMNNEPVHGGLHAVRLLEYVPGQLLVSVPYTPHLLFDVGQYLAGMHDSLQDFYHPAYAERDFMWTLGNAAKILPFVNHLPDRNKENLVRTVISSFQENVVPFMSSIRRGQIHGDFNERNILVEPHPQLPGEHRVCGILDFGDSHQTCLIFDVALAVMYLCLDSKTVPLQEVGGHALAGYLSRKEIPLNEFRLLKICVCARYCQSLVLGFYTYQSNPCPENEYVLVTQKYGWSQLEELWSVPDNVLYAKWCSVIASYGIVVDNL